MTRAPRAKRTWLWVTAGVALGAALLLPLLVFEFHKVPSGTMLPNIRPGEHVVSCRLSYSLLGGTPRPGDVIVFEYPQDESKLFLKRVIGIGGDTISFQGDRLLRNGQPLERRRLAQPCRYDDADENGGSQPRPCVLYEERSGERRYRIIHDQDRPPPLDFKPVRVPAGHVYVLGDNRDNSHDSRYWGTVPPDKITGKVLGDL